MSRSPTHRGQLSLLLGSRRADLPGLKPYLPHDAMRQNLSRLHAASLAVPVSDGVTHIPDEQADDAQTRNGFRRFGSRIGCPSRTRCLRDITPLSNSDQRISVGQLVFG
jgi:hypothetical protein